MRDPSPQKQKMGDRCASEDASIRICTAARATTARQGGSTVAHVNLVALRACSCHREMPGSISISCMSGCLTQPYNRFLLRGSATYLKNRWDKPLSWQHGDSRIKGSTKIPGSISRGVAKQLPKRKFKTSHFYVF